MTDESPKPPSSLTQIPTAALPKFGFELKEALALEKLKTSPEAQARREQEEAPAARQAEFARSIAQKLIAEEMSDGAGDGPGDLPPPPARPSGRGR
jgi:hypothetical protein